MTDVFRVKPSVYNAVMKKTSYKCYFCGIQLNDDTVTIDHATPKSRGGNNEKENLLPSCRECNCSKSSLTVDEFRLRIKHRVLEELNKSITKLNKANKFISQQHANKSYEKISGAFNYIQDVDIRFYGDSLNG